MFNIKQRYIGSDSKRRRNIHEKEFSDEQV